MNKQTQLILCSYSRKKNIPDVAAYFGCSSGERSGTEF